MLAISHGTAKEMFLSREILLLVKCMKNHVRSHPGFCAGLLYEKSKNKTEMRNISSCTSNARQTLFDGGCLCFEKLHDPKELGCVLYSV